MFEIKELKKEKYIEVIYKLETKIFTDPWTKRMIKGEFNNKLAVVLGVINRKTKELVGYSFLLNVFDEIHINNIAVKESYREKGLGKKVLDYIIKYGKENYFSRITLEVRESNKRALNLYYQNGFIIISRRTGYYSNPKEDALILMKNLKENN
ncbi:MAG: ribosomal protein S18-alanine N-acetyltransferase [Bacillota bacterium]|nr:ribosomal protein S18-alanine N-acetyltransferase [Bacillota bacterium]